MKPRAVLVTPVVPGETGNGLSMRAGAWLESLAGDFAVDLVVVALFPAHPSAPAFARGLAATVTVLTIDPDHRDDGSVRLAGDGEARLARLYHGSAVTVVFRLYLAHLIPACRLPAGEPPPPVTILDLDDLDWVRERRLGNGGRADAFERQAARLGTRFDVVTAANAAELHALTGAMADAERIHVPNPAREPVPQHLRGGHPPRSVDLLFVGTLGYEPNERGAQWLLDEVAPLLPGVSIALVGALPSEQLRARADEHAIVAADVDEVSSWYDAASIAVVPVHEGSGSRTKIAEAWAHRTPVVTTSVGCEGIADIERHRSVRVADTPAEFAAACRRLLADPASARELALAGRQHYEASFTVAHACAQIARATERAQIRSGA